MTTPTGTLLARGATIVVTMDDQRREIAGGGLFARDGVIETIGPDVDLPRTADTVLDLAGQLLLPGLINCHHHLDQTLTRALPGAQDAELFDWLGVHYRLWRRRTPEGSHGAALVGLAELLRSGCTTVFDHSYLFQNGCRVDDQIAAAREIGVRFVASRGSMSLGQSHGGLPPDDCVEREDAILVDCERVIARYHDASPGAMTQIVLAPCSPFSVTEGLMRDSATMARRHGVKLHTHLCETIDEERFTGERFGVRPIEYVRRLGWEGDDVWFAHAVHMNDAEITSLGRSRTGMCHCPSSNMRLASGIAPVRRCVAAGMRVGLGVDGSASNDGNDMLGETRQAMLLARLRRAVVPGETAFGWASARDTLELATRGGAAVLGRSDIGVLAPGRCADFFTLALDDVAYAGAQADPVAAALFCAPRPARHVVVGGRAVVRDYALTTIDLAATVRAHNDFAARLLSP